MLPRAVRAKRQQVFTSGRRRTAPASDLVPRRGSHDRCSGPLPAAVTVTREAKHVSLRERAHFQCAKHRRAHLRKRITRCNVRGGRRARASGMLLPSRPPHRSSSPSARAAAAAYIRAHGPSPLACTLCHLYGLTAVSSAHASASGCSKASAQHSVLARHERDKQATRRVSAHSAAHSARLVAVVASQHKQKALAHERKDVRVPRAWPFALHNLHGTHGAAQ